MYKKSTAIYLLVTFFIIAPLPFASTHARAEAMVQPAVSLLSAYYKPALPVKYYAKGRAVSCRARRSPWLLWAEENLLYGIAS
jgi:hypothetical protein